MNEMLKNTHKQTTLRSIAPNENIIEIKMVRWDGGRNQATV